MRKPQYKGFYNIIKNTSKNEATIFIYGIIGGFDYEKWEWINTANKFIEDFRDLEKNFDLIHIKINSPGGSVWDGLPIYNIIKNSVKETRTYVDGIAYSMAALLALAGDKVYGYSNSLLMFHNGSTGIFGNAKELRYEADTLDTYDISLGTIIEEKLDINKEEVKDKYLNYNDNYFTAEKAIELGFYDEIITTKTVDVPEDIKNMSPKDLLEHYSKMNFETSNGSTKTKKPKKTINMAYTNIEEAIGAKFENSEVKDGIILTEKQAKLVENLLGSLNKSVKDNKEDEKSSAAQLIDLNKTHNKLIKEVNTSLNLKEEAKAIDFKSAIKVLNEKIEELNAGPGDEHTKVKNKNEKDNVHSYIDFDTVMYKIK